MCEWKYLEPMEIDVESLMERYVSDPAVSAYLKEIALFQPLPADVQEELAKQTLDGDQAAREQLIGANLGMVTAIATTYAGRGLCLLDLISVGNIGLMRALETFDPAEKAPFARYVQLCIHRAIARELYEACITPRIPTKLLERINAVVRCRQTLKEELGREPDVEEIAQATGLTEEQIRAAIHLDEPPLSLDAPVSDEDDTPLGDQIPAEVPDLNIAEEQVRELLEYMRPREAEVIRLRFGMVDGQPHTLEEVAEILGITRERVRQIENKAIRPIVRNRMRRRKRIQDFYN